MTRLLKIFLFTSLSGATIAQAAETNALDAITVDQNWQLFLDDYVVGRATGFDRVRSGREPGGEVTSSGAICEGAGFGLPSVASKESSRLCKSLMVIV